MKHVVNTEHLPPESDDIDRAEENEKECQLDPWEANRHGESSARFPRSKSFKALVNSADFLDA